MPQFIIPAESETSWAGGGFYSKDQLVVWTKVDTTFAIKQEHLYIFSSTATYSTTDLRNQQRIVVNISKLLTSHKYNYSF